ncbi:hypothetical protein Tco_0534258 [Tanacetum coccineum]
MFEEKVKTPPDSPTIIIIDPDDQPKWSSTRTVASMPSFAIVQLPIHNLTIKDDPTQGILDAEGIFLYNTPNEAFKILKDKVLLKLDLSKDPHIKPEPKIIVSAGGSNIDVGHEILMEKIEDLTSYIDSEFLFIRKDLKEMRDSHKDNHASQIYMKDDTPMCDRMEANYVQGYHKGNHDQSYRNSFSYPNHHYP